MDSVPDRLTGGEPDRPDMPTGQTVSFFDLEELAGAGYNSIDYQELYDWYVKREGPVGWFAGTLAFVEVGTSGDPLLTAHPDLPDRYDEFVAGRAAVQIAKRRGLDQADQLAATFAAAKQVSSVRRLLGAKARVTARLEGYWRASGGPERAAAQAAAFLAGQFYEYAKDAEAWQASARERMLAEAAAGTLMEGVATERQAERTGALEHSYEARLIFAGLRAAWESNAQTSEGTARGPYLLERDITRAIDEARIEVQARKETRAHMAAYLKATNPEAYKAQIKENLEVNVIETIDEGDLRIGLSSIPENTGHSIKASSSNNSQYLLLLDSVYICDLIASRHWQDSPAVVDAMITPETSEDEGRNISVTLRDQAGERLHVRDITEHELYGWGNYDSEEASRLLRDIDLLCELSPTLKGGLGIEGITQTEKRKEALARLDMDVLLKRLLASDRSSLLGSAPGAYAALDVVADKLEGFVNSATATSLHDVIEDVELRDYPKVKRILDDYKMLGRDNMPPVLSGLLKQAEQAEAKGQQPNIIIERFAGAEDLSKAGYTISDLEELSLFLDTSLWADKDGVSRLSEYITVAAGAGAYRRESGEAWLTARVGLLAAMRELSAYEAHTSAYIGEVADVECIALAEDAFSAGLQITTVDRGALHPGTPWPVSAGKWAFMEPELKAHIGHALTAYFPRRPSVLEVGYYYSPDGDSDSIYRKVEIDAHAKGDHRFDRIERLSGSQPDGLPAGPTYTEAGRPTTPLQGPVPGTLTSPDIKVNSTNTKPKAL
jgi:hypothetical protein